MTISSRKSYNHEALRGGELDDMEVVESLGLDPKVAYTPAINDAVAQKVWQSNYDFYIESGMSESEAKTRANNNKRIADNTTAMLMKRIK